MRVPPAHIETTPQGKVPVDGGWFILNLGEMAWEAAPGFGAWRAFDAPDADPSQPGMGLHVHVFQPGESNGFYHAEAAQEGFIVLSGECLAIVEGEERRMRQWDYLHSPPGTAHITVGAGDEPCAILMFGSPDPSRKVEWIADETAARHGVSVATTTSNGTEVYGDLPEIQRVPAPSPFT
ncbi:cupin domain-containing protein [Solirubrobacter phytolaccae]|uniref:Cupin domain-containing protein n=1 Tax=Solirubrobacter phytolaccae TaxID=1404360 RepID=A0A9X3N6I7_9ACTN|nr:cupin domain-containing protein [Solirubrobacter phytolaccae]MDA0180391.1 cupin domain-containing protein [Solirubrobacter phytolaccae]